MGKQTIKRSNNSVMKKSYMEEFYIEDFIMDLEDLTIQLGKRKDTLKRIITRDFTKDVDYKIFVEISGKKGGRPKEKIFITPKVFNNIKFRYLNKTNNSLQKNIESLSRNIYNLTKAVDNISKIISKTNLSKKDDFEIIGSITDNKVNLNKVSEDEDLRAKVASKEFLAYKRLHEGKYEHSDFMKEFYKEVANKEKKFIRFNTSKIKGGYFYDVAKKGYLDLAYKALNKLIK